jgi:hypothetical protein
MPTTFTYAQVEHAVAQALGLGLVQQRSVLRARIKHFMKVGLLNIEKGRARAHYTYGQFAQLLVALVLTELGGMDPTTVAAVVKNNWPTVARTIQLVAGYEATSGQHYYLIVTSRTMTGPWLRKPALSIAVLQFQAITQWTSVVNSQLLQLMAENQDSWFAVYDLTRIFNRAETALPSKA